VNPEDRPFVVVSFHRLRGILATNFEGPPDAVLPAENRRAR
jgi:hypothetical protein